MKPDRQAAIPSAMLEARDLIVKALQERGKAPPPRVELMQHIALEIARGEMTPGAIARQVVSQLLR